MRQLKYLLRKGYNVLILIILEVLYELIILFVMRKGYNVLILIILEVLYEEGLNEKQKKSTRS